MRIAHTIILACIIITGCSSSGSIEQTTKAMNAVKQVDASKDHTVAISVLHDSFLQSRNTSQYNETVVDVSGEVVAFSLSEDNLYTVTLRDGESDAVCVFDSSISGDIGDGRTVNRGAKITIRGKCFTSGLFSSNPFTIDGCHIVNN